MIRYKIRDSDWLTFPQIIANFNHFFIQPVPGVMFRAKISYEFLLLPRDDLSGNSAHVLLKARASTVRASECDAETFYSTGRT